MAGGVWQDQIVLRLPAERRAEAVTTAGAVPFEPMGRAMKEYVSFGPEQQSDAAGLGRWIGEALAHAASLPARVAKPRRRKKA